MVKIWRRFGGDGRTYASLQNADLLGVDLASGRPLAVEFPKNLFVRLEKAAPPDDYFYAGRMVIVSEKLKRVFDDVGVRAQYFKVPVVGPRGRRLKKRYFYANLLTVVDCLDWGRTKGKREGGCVTQIRKIALHAKRITDEPLFYVAKTVSPVLCAQKQLIDAVARAKCVGPTFADPKDWVGPGWIFD